MEAVTEEVEAETMAVAVVAMEEADPVEAMAVAEAAPEAVMEAEMTALCSPGEETVEVMVQVVAAVTVPVEAAAMEAEAVAVMAPHTLLAAAVVVAVMEPADIKRYKNLQFSIVNLCLSHNFLY